jgi:DNA-binding transcriptional LysR family regulator
MEIQHLYYFVTTCALGNFAKAAEVCYISPQGISMAIKRLENELNCKLIERYPKGITLTECGEFLLPIAEKIVKLLGECDAYFISGRGQEQRLSICMTWGAFDEFADKPIAVFNKLFPNIFLKIHHDFDLNCETAVDVMDAELALCAGPIDQARFDSQLLFTTRYGVIVKKDHPFAMRKSISIRNLDGVPLVMMRENQKAFAVLNASAVFANVSLNISAFVDSAFLPNQYVSLVSTVGISTESMARKYQNLNLRFIPFDDNAISWRLYIIWKRDCALSEPARNFCNILASQASQACNSL